LNFNEPIFIDFESPDGLRRLIFGWLSLKEPYFSTLMRRFKMFPTVIHQKGLNIIGIPGPRDTRNGDVLDFLGIFVLSFSGETQTMTSAKSIQNRLRTGPLELQHPLMI
jgi:hypothetical protein